MRRKELRRFRRKPQTEQKQRKVFIVRAVCPECTIGYTSERARKAAEMGELPNAPNDIKEDIIYLMNNLGLQVPVDRVFLIDNGHEDNTVTRLAIKEKLAGYDLSECLADIWIPSTSMKLNKWLKQLYEEWKYMPGTIIAVVDQATFDRWSAELYVPRIFGKYRDYDFESCIYVTDGLGELQSVA